MKYLFLFLSICSAFMANVATATVLRVPSEYPTIQRGVNAAVDGDTVLVADGTYTGDGASTYIDFKGKAIVVMSENGPEFTIFNCTWDYCGFYFHSGEDTNSILQGFTITNATAGGGGNGGAIICTESSPTIRGNIIVGNVGRYHGGIRCTNSSAIIEENIIADNESQYIRSRFGPRGSGDGGGIYCVDSPGVIIRNNIIVGNKADHDGGGIHIYNCMAAPFIEGNVIVGNQAIQQGGAIYCGASSLTLKHNTVTGNEALNFEGGGIYCCGGSYLSASNCIFWADSAGSGDHEIFLTGGSVVEISYSDISGGWEGEGNIDADPLFLMPTKHDYRLLWGSPCIDSGHPDSLDPDGTRSDMGAFYFDQSTPVTIYLTPDTTVYHRYQNLGVTYTVINIDPDPVTFSLRTDVYLPNGKPYPGNPVVGPKEITLGGGKTRQRWIKHYIPGKAPFGVFTYTTTLNSVFYNDFIDEDSFRFAIKE
jgi:predicted outer membrane repeat protein